MEKLEFESRSSLIELFKNPTSAIIKAVLCSNIGETWITDKSANPIGIILVENTFYIGGTSINKEAVDFLMEQILRKEISLCYIIPQKKEMSTYFDDYFNQKNLKHNIIKSERHLMDINMNQINQERLLEFMDEVTYGR